MRGRVSAVCLLILLAGGCAPDAGGPKPDCAINNGPCSKALDGAAIELDLNPKPVRAMRELEVSVKLDSSAQNPVPLKRVMLELSMPGMYMGENRVLLSHAGGGLYTGKAVIPRCTSGKRLWMARVEAGSASTVFLFDVEQ